MLDDAPVLLRKIPFDARETLKSLSADGPVGNRWLKVNLHVHARGNDPAEVVAAARRADVDIIAITDHQAFDGYAAVAGAAETPGRSLVVFPGIEMTSVEGVHLLGIFPKSFDDTAQKGLLGWLEITGSGSTKAASVRGVEAILQKVDSLSGVTVVPHPFTDDIGMLASASKMNMREKWLDSGFVHLLQVSETHRDRIRYVESDTAGNWVNRFVLSTASRQQVEASRYCLAPFNRSDAHQPDEVAVGCSWFRMSEASILGLKQVACEPKTRIAIEEPPHKSHAAVLGLRVTGGYCDGEFIQFNDGLNCIVGPNYAGKSAILDFIRFGLGHERRTEPSARIRLLRRLYGILTPGGQVELFLRLNGQLLYVKRGFNPNAYGEGDSLTVEELTDEILVYSYDPEVHELLPVESFDFPLEFYEQGRISRLRDDVDRQLEMLDEFAGVDDLKTDRNAVVEGLSRSADKLGDLYNQRETLRTEVVELPGLQKELTEKQKLLPGEAEQHWANAEAFVQSAEALVESTTDSAVDVEALFADEVPTYDAESVVEPAFLEKWRSVLAIVLAKVRKSRDDIVVAVDRLQAETQPLREEWQKSRESHDASVREQLAKVGVESPQEIIDRVAELRRKTRDIQTVKQPKLAELRTQIEDKETARKILLEQLKGLQENIYLQRKQKAAELSDQLKDLIQIAVKRGGHKTDYLATLRQLAEEVTTGHGRRIRNRDEHLARIVSSVTPLQLAEALENDGRLNGQSLAEVCGVTENTCEILCEIAHDVRLLNRLQTTDTPDVPDIRVRRRGEEVFADLRTGLSPGEQSAAILTLALQTHSTPLIIDQPEDELGYSYVVHLVVPKILRAKFIRQMLIVTHNANIPVLGDADYVIQMENRPRLNGDGRKCRASCGCFENEHTTKALIELEGGERAFRFRQNRYALPR